MIDKIIKKINSKPKIATSCTLNMQLQHLKDHFILFFDSESNHITQYSILVEFKTIKQKGGMRKNVIRLIDGSL